MEKQRVKKPKMKVNIEVDSDDDFDLDFKRQNTELKKEKERLKLASKTIGGEDVFAEHPTLSNDLFGDLIMTIELYNTHMRLLEELLDEENFKEDVKLTKIDYDKLMECLKDDENSEDNFNYFISIIETLLRVLMSSDKNIIKKNINSISQINKFNRQDLCRIALQIDRKLCDSYNLNTESLHPIYDLKVISNTMDVLMYDDTKVCNN